MSRTNHEIELLRDVARAILRRPDRWEWSLQGLGMLRLYVEQNLRLHVFDTRFAFPGASPIHDHLQWSLESIVLSGELCNVRYSEHAAESNVGELYHWTTFRVGAGCFMRHEPKDIRLLSGEPEVYHAGDVYSQKPAEIHWSRPKNGTVTMMRKHPSADGESARIFWPHGTQWGSAEPRPATKEEIDAITRHALQTWAG